MQTYQQALASITPPRRCRDIEWLDGMRCRVDGREAVNFSSNDYLGLSRHPRLVEASCRATREWGTGTGSSRLICGTQPEVVALEEEIARFKKTEAALVLNSGYQANVTLLQSFLAPGDWVFGDKLNHASLVDGCRLSGARLSRYNHLDLEHLRLKLSKAPPDARKWVVTDSVFSMDGDYPDLAAWQSLCEEFGAMTLVDEAHATGVFGSGLCARSGIQDRVTLQMGTFSKALGGFGAYAAGSEILIRYLVNFSRGFIYSTALPPGVVAANHEALRLVHEDDAPRRQLWENIKLFESLLADSGYRLTQRSPIFPIVIGDSQATMAACEQLLSHGCFVQGIRPPTVPEGTGRLRVTITALHTSQQINGLAEALQPYLGA